VPSGDDATADGSEDNRYQPVAPVRPASDITWSQELTQSTRTDEEDREYNKNQ
jgi:hypothetical protein